MPSEPYPSHPGFTSSLISTNQIPWVGVSSTHFLDLLPLKKPLNMFDVIYRRLFSGCFVLTVPARLSAYRPDGAPRAKFRFCIYISVFGQRVIKYSQKF